MRRFNKPKSGTVKSPPGKVVSRRTGQRAWVFKGSTVPLRSLPLMIAIIGGETRQFRPLVDVYREYGRRAGHAPEKLKVGIHVIGYVGETTQRAVDDFFPGYAKTFSRIGRERGWAPVMRSHFDAARSKNGAMMTGNPEEVAEKILRHSEALGGISRITFQMDVAELSQANFLQGIELLGSRVAPLLRENFGIP
jgi:alkanesulfonate monooxygenase SsuD/methylene tetrahydromethanopterin reductase-like flavin-dependent oxidoreductase (luciferase family)